MLKIKELRIGNFLEYRSQIIEIESFTKSGFHYIQGGTLFSIIGLIDRLKPVELTEEWLLKMGFEKKSWFSQGIVIECVYYEMNGVIVYLIKSGFEIEIKHNDDQFNLLRVWKYLHELQNIFKIFTGEELTIK